jgi:hypothetical protein
MPYNRRNNRAVRFVYGAKDLYVALNSTASVAEEPFQPAKPDYNDEDPIAKSTTSSTNTTSLGARRLSYVIDTDNRRAITSTTTYPWCGWRPSPAWLSSCFCRWRRWPVAHMRLSFKQQGCSTAIDGCQTAPLGSTCYKRGEIALH